MNKMSLSAFEILEIFLSGKPLPPNTLSQCDPQIGRSLVEDAINFDNLDGVKRLIAAGLDVNYQENGDGPFLLEYAILHRRHDIVEYLLAAGANIANVSRYADVAITFAKNCDHCKTLYVLLAYGSKLEPEDATYGYHEEYRFQQGVTRCRDVIVTLLGLKKRRQILGKLDRFLVSQVLAVEIWATRSCENEQWQSRRTE